MAKWIPYAVEDGQWSAVTYFMYNPDDVQDISDIYEMCKDLLRDITYDIHTAATTADDTHQKDVDILQQRYEQELAALQEKHQQQLDDLQNNYIKELESLKGIHANLRRFYGM